MEPAQMKSLEQNIAWTMQYCQHYKSNRGAINCNAGVDIATVRLQRNDAANVFGQPCIHGHLLPDATAVCPHWIRSTREEGEKRADEWAAVIKKFTLVTPVVSAWRTWTKKNRVAKQEVIECPVCKGKLHLSQAAYNGHVWGKCETQGCVEWME